MQDSRLLLQCESLLMTPFVAIAQVPAATQPPRVLNRNPNQVRVEKLDELLVHEPHLQSWSPSFTL